MEDLSGLNYLLGRTEIAQLEVEAGIEDIFAESAHPVALLSFGPPSDGPSDAGGMSIRNADGSDGSDVARLTMGNDEYEQFIRHASYTVERAVHDGPSDDELPTLRAQYGYAPETSREGAESRLAFELDLSERLNKDPRWRRGRMRDVVSAREVAHEWLDSINRVNEQRARDGKRPLDGDDDARRLMAAMPHTQVAISIKTHDHRNPNHRWDTNDITGIDAASVAYSYCDAVFTDKAVRRALAASTELRQFGTYVPRTPHDFCAWLDSLPSLTVPDMVVTASSAAPERLKTEEPKSVTRPIDAPVPTAMPCGSAGVRVPLSVRPSVNECQCAAAAILHRLVWGDPLPEQRELRAKRSASQGMSTQWVDLDIVSELPMVATSRHPHDRSVGHDRASSRGISRCGVGSSWRDAFVRRRPDRAYRCPDPAQGPLSPVRPLHPPR